MTKFLSPSVKILAHDNDNLVGYPSISRKIGIFEVDEKNTYNDATTTQLFTQKDILFPYMTTAADAEFATGTLVVNTTPKSHSQFLEKNSRLSTAVIKPYSETLNPAGIAADFASKLDTTIDDFASGFPSGSYPGFFNPIDDKIAINVNISTNQSKELFRDYFQNPVEGYTIEGSGFYYFNFVNSSWEDIGLRNPFTGNPVDADSLYRAGTNTIEKDSLSNIYSQFTATPNIASIAYITGALASTSALNDAGYDKIGIPTALFSAPNASRYYATSSQLLNLANYIDKPFALEKILVELPVQTIRRHRDRTSTGWTLAAPNNRVEGFARDMDNHVFFIYLQHQTTSSVESADDINDTRRELIANSSMCFYNSASLGSIGLQHDPGYSFEYGMGPLVAAEVTASHNVTMLFRPRVYNRQFGCVSHMGSLLNDSSANLTTLTSSFVQNFWHGGTSPVEGPGAENVYGVTFSSLAAVTGSGDYNKANVITSFLGSTPGVETDIELSITARTLKHSIPEATNKLISTHIFKRKMLSGDVNFTEETDNFINFPTYIVTGSKLETKSNIADYYETPFVLLPTDNLIFGIENGTFHNPPIDYDPTPGTPVAEANWPPLFRTGRSGYDDQTSGNSLRGARKNSRLIINAGHARIVLFGSYIKNNEQYLQSSDQIINTNAVHEDISYNGSTISDEFYIADRTSFSNSDIANHTTIFQKLTFENDLFLDSNKKPKFIVSKRRYGQLADTYASSKYTRLKSLEKNKQGQNRKIFTTGSAVITCKFVISSSNTDINPYRTQCSNVSVFATSSIPFDETGIKTNRGSSAPPVAIKIPFITTTLVFGKTFTK